MNSAPLKDQNRISYLDFIRGIAILGILIVNLRWFSLYHNDLKSPWLFPKLDSLTVWLQHVFIEGKFYSIFSILFGWGMALQLKRLKDVAILQRRLTFLVLFGGLHMLLLWEGDIVMLYGLLGFVLVALRSLSPKKLLLIGVALLLSPVLLYTLKMQWDWMRFPSDYLYSIGVKIYEYFGWVDQDTSRTAVIRNATSPITLWKINLGDAAYRFGYLFEVSRASKVLGAMLIGVVIGKTDCYQRLLQNRKLCKQFVGIGALFFLPLNIWLASLIGVAASWSFEGLLFSFVFAVAVFPMALVYMLTFALWFERIQHYKITLYVLAVGKMAFSNYILQSIFGIVIFYGIGFGAMESLGPLSWSVLGIVLFAFQMVYSKLWLQYFRFGPLEWLWRSLTYGKRQTFLRDR